MGLWPQLHVTWTLVVDGSRIALAEPVIGRAFARPVGSLGRDDVNFASEFVDSFSTSKEGFKSSLRAKRSNPWRHKGRVELRRHKGRVDCFVALLLAMTVKAHYLFDFRFLLLLFFEAFFGTLLPSALASERPIAIACLRLLTLRPDRPLFRVPALRFFIARSTLADAFLEYFRAMIILPVARK
jgi:hypothetical protein